MKRTLIGLLALCMMLTSCAGNAQSSSSSKAETVVVQQTAETTTTTAESVSDESSSVSLTVTKNPNPELLTQTEADEEDPFTELVEYSPTTDWDKLAVIAGANVRAEDWAKENGKTAFVEINGNIPFFDEGEKQTTTSFEEYSPLDELGRCGTAYANIGKDIMPTEKRGEIGSVKPSGWQTSKYDKSIISDMYLYNRCHLIAYMLAGENANEQNLITGTRYLNIEGMLPFEDMVHDYMEDNPDNHVLYRVTPMYHGDDLVAQGVLMEGYSVEDEGAGIQFCVWCYNVQPKIWIDYNNGDNMLNPTTDTVPEPMDTKEQTSVTYVLNTKSKKIHYPDCKAVADMNDENKEETHKTIKELTDEGYEPCGICKPE